MEQQEWKEMALSIELGCLPSLLKGSLSSRGTSSSEKILFCGCENFYSGIEISIHLGYTKAFEHDGQNACEEFVEINFSTCQKLCTDVKQMTNDPEIASCESPKTNPAITPFLEFPLATISNDFE